jgi:hypothetical protein
LAVCYNYAAKDLNENKAQFEKRLELFDTSKEGGLQLLACLIKYYLGSILVLEVSAAQDAVYYLALI